MKFLICTVFNIDGTSAGLNRLLRMRQAVESFGIDLILVGLNGDMNEPWKEILLQGKPAIAFSGKHTGIKRYCRAMTFGAQAASFYKKKLPHLLEKYECNGAIAYSVQAQMVKEVLNACRSQNKLALADMVEWFSLSTYYLLNGVSFQQWNLCRSVLPKMDGIIGISKAWCDWAKSKGVPSVWIPSLAQDYGCIRTEPSPKDQPFTITFIGHLARRELPLVILRALRICIDRGMDIRMNILGNINTNLGARDAFKMINSHPELKKNVNFLGFVDDQEKDRQLAQADTFIILRPACRETDMLFPTRLPEYLLTANPVILSKTGSFPYCFEHGKDVWFISKENRAEELAEGLIWLKENPDQRMEIGRHGRQTALSQFSLDVLGKRLAAFLEDLKIN